MYASMQQLLYDCVLAVPVWQRGTGTGLADEGPADGGHLLPVLADGAAPEHGERRSTLRPLHQAQRQQEAQQLRTGEGM